MTWNIGPILLPIEPSQIRKKTLRVQQPAQNIGNFPDPTINQPARFELQIKGFIWPRSLAQQLDEATKNADTENLAISVPEETTAGENAWLSGFYSVSRSSIDRKKPLFTRMNGVDVEVYEYNITFAKFADLGTDQPSEEAGPEEDEIGTGFLDMDADDNGKIDLEGIYNFMTSIFTWGATDP